MAVNLPVVPEEIPDQSNLSLIDAPTPYSALWWSSQTITGIPESSVGWMVSQGWQITSVTYIQDGQPPTPRYNMSKQALDNSQILQSLLNEYTCT